MTLAHGARATTAACGAVYSICGPDGHWLGRDLARHSYDEVWDMLTMAMEKSRKEASSLPDSAKMMNFFRHEVARRLPQADQPEAYEALMLQIV